jgi:hypothetical protein
VRAARPQQTISFIEISIEAGILLGGKHEACFVLGVAGIEPMPSWPNWPGHRFRLEPTWLRDLSHLLLYKIYYTCSPISGSLAPPSHSPFSLYMNNYILYHFFYCILYYIYNIRRKHMDASRSPTTCLITLYYISLYYVYIIIYVIYYYICDIVHYNIIYIIRHKYMGCEPLAHNMFIYIKLYYMFMYYIILYYIVLYYYICNILLYVWYCTL